MCSRPFDASREDLCSHPDGAALQQLDDIKKQAHEIDSAEDYIPPNPPATEEEIQKVEELWSIVFPEDYKNFLMICNGWEM